MAEGKFVISAQNKIKEGLDGAKKDLLGFEDAANKVGKTITNALTVTAIAAGLKKLGEAMFDCYTEFGEGDRRLRQLKIALDNNDASLTKATDLIDSMRKMSLASKDDIEGLVAELAMLGKSDSDIEAITTAAVNLSNVTGKDLATSYNMLASAQTGQVRSLKILLPEVSNLTTEQLAAGGAIGLVNEKFTKLSSDIANGDISQNLKNLSDSFGDLKENIGELSSGIFSGFASQLQTFLDGLNNAFGQYKAFLDAKNALTAEDKAKALVAQRNYILEEKKAAEALQASELARIYGYVRKANPKARSIENLVQQEKEKDVGYNYAKGALAAVEYRLKNVDTQLDDIKKTTGIDYKTTFAATPPRTQSDDGHGGLKTKDPLAAFLEPIMSGPLSARGYSFAKQFYEQFEKGIWDGYKLGNTPSMGPGIGWAGQSAVPGPLGAGGASVYDQVWKEIIDGMQAEFTTPQQRMAPEGYAPRSDFFEQLYGALSLLASQQSDQAGATKYGKEYRDAFQKFTAGETLRQTIAKQLNENTKVSGSLTPSGILADLLGGARAPTATPWKMGDKQTFGQSGIIPPGLLGGRSDFTEQLISDVVLPASLQAAEDGAIAFGQSYREGLAAWDVAQDTAKTLDAMWNEALDQMAADYKTKPGSMGQSGITPAGTNPTPITDQIAALFPDVLSQITTGMTSAFDTVTASMGNFDAAMIGPITTIMEALGPFGEMLAGMNPLLALLIPVIEGFVSVIGPAITEVLAPLFNALTQVGQMLGAALLPILDALMPIFSLLANHILTNFSMVMQMLSPVVQVVALVFQRMTPILTLLSKVFVILMSPVQYLADLFSWLGGVMQTFAWNIQHPFRSRGYEGFSSDAFSGLPARLAAIDAMGTNSQSLTAGYSQSDATATQSANYRTQPITVNIYQQAPVVGSDGMSEFARMIRGEIEMLAYAGA